MSLTHDAERARLEARDASMFSIFAALFALGVGFDAAFFSFDDRAGIVAPQTLVLLAAAWVLCRPRSSMRFLVLVAAQVVATAIELPTVPNHNLFLAIGGIAMLVWAALHAGARPGPAAMLRQFGPYLRLGTIAVYVLAVFSKLNDGYFDRVQSCAVVIYRDVRDTVPLLPGADGVAGLVIWSTLAIELLLAVLLLVPRTRLIGVVLGVAFHIVLALGGHIPFAAVAIGMYALFLPPDLPEHFTRARARWSDLDGIAARTARTFAWPWAFPVLAIGILVVVGGVAGDLPGIGRIQSYASDALLAAFVIYALLLGLMLLACWMVDHAFARPAWGLRPAGWIWWLAIAVVVVNASMPYVGLRTHASFTMYSNLRTEPGLWNHFLLPDDVRIFGWQDDPVEILASDDPDLAEAADHDERWLLYEVQDHVAQHPDISVTYRIDGRRIEAERAGDDPLLGDAPPPLMAKVFLSRTVPAAGVNLCQH